MNYKQPLIQGKFLERLNRFAVRIQIADKIILAHMANSGRLGELLIPGRTAYIAEARSDTRKTTHDFLLIASESGSLVSVDASLPNVLFQESYFKRRLEPFLKYPDLDSEVTVGKSRLDFVLTSKTESCYIEVKSITLVVDGIGRFPDAVTARGVKHLEELIEIRSQGHRAAVVFIVQRPDVEAVEPNDASDPVFGETFRQAIEHGVEAFAWRCDVSPGGVTLDEMIPIQVRKSG